MLDRYNLLILFKMVQKCNNFEELKKSIREISLGSQPEVELIDSLLDYISQFDSFDELALGVTAEIDSGQTN